MGEPSDGDSAKRTEELCVLRAIYGGEYIQETSPDCYEVRRGAQCVTADLFAPQSDIRTHSSNPARP